MIRRIQGTVLSLQPFAAVIDVSGWGVEVHTTSLAGLQIGSSASFHTHLSIKQDGVELYGFESVEDLRFFELAVSVSGIGPKKAMTLLRRAPRENLESAIAKRDLGYLTRVAGLGKKSAEKLMLELSEKVGGSGATTIGEDGEVFDTLVALGYTEREARVALASIPPEVSGKEARLRAALGAS